MRKPTAAEIAAEVAPADYQRLLGLPSHRTIEGLLAERAAWAREWYAQHGQPFLQATRHAIVELGEDSVRLEADHRFSSRTLAERLRRWGAHAMLGLAASAGAAIDEACAQLWQDGKPDEAYFLERFGVAVVERLIFSATLGHCRQASGSGETIMPHLSPGCGSWDLGEQRLLWDAIFPAGALGPIRLLDSGGLEPKNSILAAAGVTHQTVNAAPADACRACDLPRCAFRRAAFRGAS